MPAPRFEPDAPTDIVIWRELLVVTMADLLKDAMTNAAFDHCWGIAPWRRMPLYSTLQALRVTARHGWIITEVPLTLLDETRILRVEAHRRLQGR